MNFLILLLHQRKENIWVLWSNPILKVSHWNKISVIDPTRLMTEPPVARICWVQEKVLRKSESVQSVHFWGWCFFQIPYGWAEVSKEPLSCSPCLSQGWIIAARKSAHHFTVPSSSVSHFYITDSNSKFIRMASNILFCVWAVSTWSLAKALRYKSIPPQEEWLFSNAILAFLFSQKKYHKGVETILYPFPQ